MVKTGVIPNYYLPMTHWVDALFVIDTVLTLSGVIGYGGALLLTRPLPRLLGWGMIVYSLAWFVYAVFTGDLPPFLHHLLPIVTGVLLLLRRYQIPTRSLHEEEPAVAARRNDDQEGNILSPHQQAFPEQRTTSSLDGQTALPLRTRWIASPEPADTVVAKVDFLIDGKVSHLIAH
jgi:hypothetical protein